MVFWPVSSKSCVQNLHGRSVERTVSRRSRHSSFHDQQGRRFSPFESDVISFRKVDPISPLRIPTFLPLFRCPPTILKSLRHPSADFPFINSNFTVPILSLPLFIFVHHVFLSLGFSFYLFIFSFSLLFRFSPRAKSQFNERIKMVNFCRDYGKIILLKHFKACQMSFLCVVESIGCFI